MCVHTRYMELLNNRHIGIVHYREVLFQSHYIGWCIRKRPLYMYIQRYPLFRVSFIGVSSVCVYTCMHVCESLSDKVHYTEALNGHINDPLYVHGERLSPH